MKCEYKTECRCSPESRGTPGFLMRWLIVFGLLALGLGLMHIHLVW